MGPFVFFFHLRFSSLLPVAVIDSRLSLHSIERLRYSVTAAAFVSSSCNVAERAVAVMPNASDAYSSCSCMQRRLSKLVLHS